MCRRNSCALDNDAKLVQLFSTGGSWPKKMGHRSVLMALWTVRKCAKKKNYSVRV